MLSYHSALGEFPVRALLLFGQLFSFGLLFGEVAVGMQLSPALIAFISQSLSSGVQPDPTGLKQQEVMSSSFAVSCADNPSALLVNHKLGFEGMCFLFATIELLLSVLGPLNWRFSDIHHYDGWYLMPSQEPFLARQPEAARTNQGSFDVVNDPANSGF
jgi:hypothetical protein